MYFATSKVEDMDIGLTLSLKNLQGSLMLSVQDCGCNVKDISIKLDGGASLVYQGYRFHVSELWQFSLVLLFL